MFIVLGQKLTGKAFHVLNGFFKKKFLNRNNCFKDIFSIQGKKAAVENHSGYSRLGMGESNFTPQN